MTYDQSYFASLNYTNYLERGERYSRMARELDELFGKISIRDPQAPVLDFGCAVGFLVSGFQGLGYTHVSGYDVSQWAITYGQETLGLPTLTTDSTVLTQEDWHHTLALDVLEHMPILEISSFLPTLKTKYLTVRIPLGGKQGFTLDVSRRDPTHITSLSRSEWQHLFETLGFTWMFDLNLGTIYNSPGVLAAVFRGY